jgi:DNA-binding NarL/FixJ family response regulator
MRVVIADDAVLLREGLVRLLEDEGFEVVGQVADAIGLVEAVEHERPDVCVVDVRMPPTHTDEGLRAAIEIRSRWPETAVLVLSQYVEERYATELLSGDTRGVGYLLKDRVADVRDFVEALRRVAGGDTALDPEIVAQLLARARRHPHDELTAREREVLIWRRGCRTPGSRDSSSSPRAPSRSTSRASSRSSASSRRRTTTAGCWPS